jgi:hypothetical protein
MRLWNIIRHIVFQSCQIGCLVYAYAIHIEI